jgi:hypothetical protein
MILSVREILESKKFQELLSEMKRDMFNEWSEASTVEARESIFANLAVLERLVETLNTKSLETT